jgi:sigma-E factor negative regulatory protein RseC
MLLGGVLGWLAARGGRAARPVVLRREIDPMFSVKKG